MKRGRRPYQVLILRTCFAAFGRPLPSPLIDHPFSWPSATVAFSLTTFSSSITRDPSWKWGDSPRFSNNGSSSWTAACRFRRWWCRWCPRCWCRCCCCFFVDAENVPITELKDDLGVVVEVVVLGLVDEVGTIGVFFLLALWLASIMASFLRRWSSCDLHGVRNCKKWITL